MVATPEAISHIMIQKFVRGSPLYQQEQELNRRSTPLSRQTMADLILWATKDYLSPVYKVLHADETTLQVLHEEGKATQSESYMRLCRTSAYTAPRDHLDRRN